MVFPADDLAILQQSAEDCKSILEFGPGVSTDAFINAGCQRIATCEHIDKWFHVAVERFKDYPQVTVYRYMNSHEVTIPGLDPSERFDIAFVDSPIGAPKNRVKIKGQEGCSRLNTLLYAMNHAYVVYLHDVYREAEQASLEYASRLGWNVNIHPTRRGLACLTNFTVKYDN